MKTIVVCAIFVLELASSFPYPESVPAAYYEPYDQQLQLPTLAHSPDLYQQQLYVEQQNDNIRRQNYGNLWRNQISSRPGYNMHPVLNTVREPYINSIPLPIQRAEYEPPLTQQYYPVQHQQPIRQYQPVQSTEVHAEARNPQSAIQQINQYPQPHYTQYNTQNQRYHPRIQQVLAATPLKKRYLVLHPNGTIEHIDKIEHIVEQHPNYILMKAGSVLPSESLKTGSVAQDSASQPASQAPVAPAAPYAPLAAAAPNVPLAPLAPVTPVVSVAPQAPVAPAVPNVPVAPNAPVAPAAPAVPAAPIAPVAPAAPNAPVTSAVPVAPQAPVPPTASVIPDAPAARLAPQTNAVSAITPPPNNPGPAPANPAPAPVNSATGPVNPVTGPVYSAPAHLNSGPTPVNSATGPVYPVPAPVNSAFEPVIPVPASVNGAPALGPAVGPVDSAPSPINSAPTSQQLQPPTIQTGTVPGPKPTVQPPAGPTTVLPPVSAPTAQPPVILNGAAPGRNDPTRPAHQAPPAPPVILNGTNPGPIDNPTVPPPEPTTESSATTEQPSVWVTATATAVYPTITQSTPSLELSTPSVTPIQTAATEETTSPTIEDSPTTVAPHNPKNDLDVLQVKGVKPVVWFRTKDLDFWDKLTQGDETFDVLYFFNIQRAPRVTNETKTTIHADGTVVEETTQTIYDDEDSPPRVIKTTKVTKPDGTQSKT